MAIAAFALVTAGCSKEDIWSTTTSSSSYNTAADDSLGEDFDVNNTEDLLANTTFDATVTVTFASSGVTVADAIDSMAVATNGNDVTITYTGSQAVIYKLSGSTSDGFFKLYSSHKQELLLDGVSITNPNGAAINIQSGKRSFVVLSGSSTLADGSSYTDTPDDEDEKAAFFSEGQLVFSGSGSLTVTATGKAGITSDDYLRFLDGVTVSVSSSAGHSLRGKDAVVVTDANLTVTNSANTKKGISTDGVFYMADGTVNITTTGSAATNDDGELTGVAGVKADERFTMDGGSLTITSSGTGAKGISGDNVGYFNGGTVKVTCTGSNYGNNTSGGSGPGNGWGGGGNRPGGRSVTDTKSSDTSISSKSIKFDGNLYFQGASVSAKCSNHEAIESKATITISDGIVYAYASDDSINSASDMTITGGYVIGYSTGNDGLDANGNMYIKGGTVYAIGTSSPEVAIDANTEGGYKLYLSGGTVVAIGGLESGSSLTQSCYSTNSWTKNAWYGLTIGSNTLAFKTPSSAGSSLVVSGASTPSLSYGVTTSGGTTIVTDFLIDGTSVSGGTSVSLSSYSSGSSMGGGMGPGF